MGLSSFNKLLKQILPYMKSHQLCKAHSNGPIYHLTCLACTLRYYAGGSVYNITNTFGVSFTKVYNSIQEVVEAVNLCPKHIIKFPENHDAQQKLVDGFHKKLKANIDCCAGTIDGILIWITKPSAIICKAAGCDTSKFFCGWKHKFGLNCQAICGSNSKLIYISIMYPGSTANCLAFEEASFFQELENGLLAGHLCLFGDNAYLNAPYMALPYLSCSMPLIRKGKKARLVPQGPCLRGTQTLESHMVTIDKSVTTCDSYVQKCQTYAQCMCITKL